MIVIIRAFIIMYLYFNSLNSGLAPIHKIYYLICKGSIFLNNMELNLKENEYKFGRTTYFVSSQVNEKDLTLLNLKIKKLNMSIKR